jgi:hypothetical protein
MLGKAWSRRKMKTCSRAVILYVASACLTLHAGDLIVGEPAKPGTGNCDPFGCSQYFGLGTFQEVFLSTAFPGTISINELTFFDSQVLNGGQLAGGTYSFSFSYTNAAPGALSLLSPAANIAGEELGFFSGTLPSLVSTGSSTEELEIAGTPYVYSPAAGNLLLTIQVAAAINGNPPLYLDFSQCAPIGACSNGSQPQTGRAYFGTINGVPVSGGNDIGGLVTQFTYAEPASVPEPSSFLLLFAGAALIAFARLRRR